MWYIHAWDEHKMLWVDCTDDVTVIPGSAASFEGVMQQALRWKAEGQSVRLEFVQNKHAPSAGLTYTRV